MRIKFESINALQCNVYSSMIVLIDFNRLIFSEALLRTDRMVGCCINSNIGRVMIIEDDDRII